MIVLILVGYAQTAAVWSVLMIGSTVYTELSVRSGRLSFDRKVCLFVGCFLALRCQGILGMQAPVRPQELKPRKTHDLGGLRRRGCSKGGAPCGGEVKQRFGSKSVVLLGFSACRPPVRPQELKLCKTHDLEGPRRRSAARAVHFWGGGKTAIWLQKCSFP